MPRGRKLGETYKEVIKDINFLVRLDKNLDVIVSEMATQLGKSKAEAIRQAILYTYENIYKPQIKSKK